MSKHTPGPWAAESTWPYRVHDEHGYCVAHAAEACHAAGPANARLCAAAPDLKAACEAALLLHRGGIWGPEEQGEWERLTGTRAATTRNLGDVIRAALNKAELQP